MKKKLVYIGMSGGVDSSVAAALLKKQGYNVVGVYMKNWHSTDPKFEGVCPWEQDLRDARAVAARLDIPLEVWNFEKQYHDRVVTYFFNEYHRGRTPNPDVMCNSQIKFNEFYNKAISRGADFIATGHYARVVEGRKYKVEGESRGRQSSPITNHHPTLKLRMASQPQTTDYRLLAGLDPNKDQSYFLWDIDKEVLSKTLFPIGEYTKPEVRAMAKKFNLPVSEKKDSQGICFIGPIDVREYLKTELPVKKGDVVNINGEKVGEHEGVWFYTEGQRKGTGSSGGGIPYYVVEKDVKHNKLIVAPRASKKLFARGLIANNLNWLVEKSLTHLSPTNKISARIRYRHPAVPATIKITRDVAHITFSTPQRAVTPGQSVVFYANDHLIGGGIIDKPVL